MYVLASYILYECEMYAVLYRICGTLLYPSIHPHIKFTMNMAEAALNTQNNIPPTNTVSTTRMPQLAATDMRPLPLPCTINNQQ